MFGWARNILGTRGESPSDLFRSRARDALVDAHLSDEEWTDLQNHAVSLGLSDGEARRIYIETAMEVVEQRATEALEDGLLSPSEEHDLAILGDRLKIDLSFGDETLRALARAQRTWKLTHGDLPIVATPLGLQRGEHAHMWTTGEVFEERQRTRAVSFAGPSVSIPIMKGVRYRMGRFNVGRETFRYDHSFGVGTMVVTNKRLLFAGDRSPTVRLTNILDLTGYSDGFRVVRTTGKPHTYIYGEAADDFSTILAKAWAEARS